MTHTQLLASIRSMRLTISVLALSFFGNILSVQGAAPAPVWYFDGVTRIAKVTLADFGKTYVELRVTSAPGVASRWVADGERSEKEIVFARSVTADEVRGTFYVAVATDSSFKVKIKPGQDKDAKDEGVVGQYHRLTDERRLLLAKREFEAAEKRLEVTHKLVLKTSPEDDKPALTEIKQRWPALRERIASLRDKPQTAADANTKPPIGSGGKSAAGAPELQPERWNLKSELTGTEIGYFEVKVYGKTKDGWEGDYSDGFGGSVNILQDKDGKLRFTLNGTRGDEDQANTLSGGAIVNSTGKELTAEFTDNNAEVKDAALQTRVRFRRSGHYLYIETNKAERYTGRGWFDGVYRKQPTPAPAAE